MCKFYPPVAVNATLFGKKVFAGVVKLSRGSYWIRVDPNPMTGVLLREKCGHRHRGEGHMTGGRDWSDASTFQERPMTAGNSGRLGG